MSQSESEVDKSPASRISVRNRAEPIILADLELDGVAAEAARAGEITKIWTRLSLTSDDRFFHRVAEGLSDHIAYRARQAGRGLNLKNASMVLLIIHPDNRGDLWIDAAATAIQILTKRKIMAGSVVFESDIADVTAMSFPHVKINKDDRVICLFREGWRFALFFDLGRDLSIQGMERDLGTLYRRLKYRDVYDAIENEAVFGRLVASGWFPFVEILGTEFQSLANYCGTNFELDEAEASLLVKFGTERLERMFARWMLKPHFAGKEQLLRSAINSFAGGDAISTLKITLTEIEGILDDAYRKAHGKGAKLNALLEFAIESAEKKAGQPDTLLLPAAFALYLRSYTFANFDPISRAGHAGSRHAVGHGAAEAKTYTMARALQALLTLDQLAFYT